MKKSRILIAIALLAIASASAVSYAIVVNSKTYPSTVNIVVQPTYANFALYSSQFDGYEISTLNFGTVYAGQSYTLTYYLRKVGVQTGTYYMSWTTDVLPSYVTLQVFWNGLSEPWAENFHRMWNLDDIVTVTFRIIVSADAPTSTLNFNVYLNLHNEP